MKRSIYSLKCVSNAKRAHIFATLPRTDLREFRNYNFLFPRWSLSTIPLWLMKLTVPSPCTMFICRLLIYWTISFCCIVCSLCAHAVYYKVMYGCIAVCIIDLASTLIRAQYLVSCADCAAGSHPSCRQSAQFKQSHTHCCPNQCTEMLLRDTLLVSHISTQWSPEHPW